ncbi:MAG TPA: penicillin-binding protein activator [Chakrabartia sp.]|jgi:ABC-type branched-subunit amino acid transport system substrate-binding protein|nr:penicillin-binding protein activator [Chakrabartia sp.]
MAEAGVLRQAGWKNWLALAAATLLAACASGGRKPPKTVVTPPPVTAPTGPSVLPTDQQRHRVALLVPLTGPNAGVGESIANAATMAVLDTGGQTLRVTTYDTATGPAAAAQAAIADGAKLILGPLLAEDVRAVAPVARAARVPLVSFSNDVSVAGQGTYLMGFVPTQAIERIVAHAKAKGITRFAALVPDSLYGERSSAAMMRAVDANGGQLVGIQTFDRSAGAITLALRKLGPVTDYQALLIADSGRVAIQVVPLVRKGGGTTTQILGTELWNSESFIAQNPGMRGAMFASVPDTLYTQLATKYRARYGKAPYRLASLGYDSVLLINKVARTWKPGTVFPITSLVDPGGFSGIDGAFRFSTSGIAERALEVQQVGAGSFAVVVPAPRSFAE